MKTINIGSFEQDALGATPADWRLAVPYAIVVKGYQLSIGIRPNPPGLFGSPGGGVVLFKFDYGSGASPDFPPPAVMSGISRGGGVGNNWLALAAIEYFTNAPVTKIIAISGLSVPIGPNGTLHMSAAQAGAGPVDFEVQGVLFYEI